jgi:GNAT superfamily N-acetyltransferase
LLTLRIAVMRQSLMRIEHFHIAADHQGRGLGSAVLHRLLIEAPNHVKLFRVGALRDSDANRFYRRHGFIQVAKTEWDIDYECQRERLQFPASG